MNLDAKTFKNAPHALMLIDGALKPLACSRKGFSVFGLRAQRIFAEEDLFSLGQTLLKEGDLIGKIKNYEQT